MTSRRTFSRFIAAATMVVAGFLVLATPVVFAQTTPAAGAPAAATPAPADTPNTDIITPQLNESPPGLVFTPSTIVGGRIQSTQLGQYIAAMYRYGVGIVLIAAIIMTVYGGFRYLIGSSLGDIKAGKKIIQDAIVGMLLVLGAYLILQTVNPATVGFQPIVLQVVTDAANGEGVGAVGEEPRSESSAACQDTPQGGTSAAASPVNASRVLRVPHYYQYASPWGSKGFGPNLLSDNPTMCDNYDDPRVASGQCFYVCKSVAEQTSKPNCIGTFQQGACGVTSLASVLAYYGVNVNGHLITPEDVGSYAVRRGFRRAHNGTNPGAFRSGGISAEYPGFTSQTLGSATQAATAIRNGNPVIFMCSHCAVTKGDGTAGFGTAPGGGHYMVLIGVSEDGQNFLIHDVGHSLSGRARAHANQYISATALSGQGMWLIKPSNGGNRPTTAGTGSGAGGSTGSGSNHETITSPNGSGNCGGGGSSGSGSGAAAS